MRINNTVQEIHEIARSKGWWCDMDDGPTPLEVHALIHSEVSEATECVRNREKFYWHNNGKPEGEAAAIQSFPNEFQFRGSVTSIWEQIGNSVPPKLARALGQAITNHFKGEV